MGWVTTLAAVFVGVLGASVNTIGSVWWMSRDISSFGVTVVSNFNFFLLMWLLLLANAAYYQRWGILHVAESASERRLFVSPRGLDGSLQLTQAQLAVVIGFLFSWMSTNFNLATPPYRTPPLIQSVLLNLSVLVGIPVSKFLLGDKKRYCSAAPLLAGGLIAVGVAVSILPSILREAASASAGGASSASLRDKLIWCLIYACGNLPWALESVAEQVFLIRAGLLEDEATWFDTQIGVLRMLAWASLWQIPFTLGLFWLDLVPFVGLSSSLDEFWRSTVAAVACSYGSASAVAAAGGDPAMCAPHAPAFALLSSAGLVSCYLADAVLNRDSATFSMLNYVLITVVTTVTFLIPGLNPGDPADTPIWSVVVSIALSVVGEIMWKRWEDSSPPESQFSVEAAGAKDDGGSADAALVPLLDRADSGAAAPPLAREAPGGEIVALAGDSPAGAPLTRALAIAIPRKPSLNLSSGGDTGNEASPRFGSPGSPTAAALARVTSPGSRSRLSRSLAELQRMRAASSSAPTSAASGSTPSWVVGPGRGLGLNA